VAFPFEKQLSPVVFFALLEKGSDFRRLFNISIVMNLMKTHKIYPVVILFLLRFTLSGTMIKG